MSMSLNLLWILCLDCDSLWVKAQVTSRGNALVKSDSKLSINNNFKRIQTCGKISVVTWKLFLILTLRLGQKKNDEGCSQSLMWLK